MSIKKVGFLVLALSMPLMVQAESSVVSIEGKAITELRLAIKAGKPEAMTELGRAYAQGLGVTRDDRKAFELFQQAAGKDHQYPAAQYEMGRAYLNGTGTDTNLISAWIWSRLAASESSPVLAEAKQLNQSVSTRLNERQLEKAQELAEQVRTLYLGDGA